MTTSNTITKTDLENIINAIFPATTEDMTQAQVDAFVDSLRAIGTSANSWQTIDFLGEIATIDFKAASANWEYTGMSFTVPTGHKYLVSLYTAWVNAKPIGLGISYASTLDATGYPYYTYENANGVTQTSTFQLNPGTYYVFAKRASTPTGTNVHKVFAWDYTMGQTITAPLQSDYVVEQGTSGDWTYRKWNSGKAECWCRHTVGSVAITTASTAYGGYRSAEYSKAFPSDLFLSGTYPTAFAMKASAQGGWITHANTTSTSPQEIRWYYGCGSSTTITGQLVTIYAFGTWK